MAAAMGRKWSALVRDSPRAQGTRATHSALTGNQMNRHQMKARYIHALLFSLESAGSVIPCSNVRAELVQAHIESIINSSPIPVLNGEAWR